MARKAKLVPDLHVEFEKLGKLTPADLLAIDGPKFITQDCEQGTATLAVLISHDKWRTLNHGLPDVRPDRVGVFFIGKQAYLQIPVEQRKESAVWHAVPEVGLDIITRRKSRKKTAA